MALRPTLFRVALAAAIVVAGILAAEWYFSWNYRRLARSDRITPGLSQVDRALGWVLTPRWRGQHDHHDFSASYTVNASGFRGTDTAPAAGQPVIAIVGDSFTFGTGVNDHDVFSALLDRRDPSAGRVYNFGVPGYSTDQEVLLVEQRVLAVKPKLIVLVVYLFNDLFDNQLTTALQVRRPKPMFRLENGQLRLTNSPVPPVATEAATPTVLQMALGRRPDELSLRRRLEARSHVFRILSEALLPAAVDDAEFERRHAYALDLFWALVERLRSAAVGADAAVMLAVVGGRAYVDAPSTLPAAVQEFFRSRIASGARARNVPLIDIAAEMRRRAGAATEPWFYPYEGHFTAAGHRMVAEVVGAALSTYLAR